MADNSLLDAKGNLILNIKMPSEMFLKVMKRSEENRRSVENELLHIIGERIYNDDSLLRITTEVANDIQRRKNARERAKKLGKNSKDRTSKK